MGPLPNESTAIHHGLGTDGSSAGGRSQQPPGAWLRSVTTVPPPTVCDRWGGLCDIGGGCCRYQKGGVGAPPIFTRSHHTVYGQVRSIEKTHPRSATRIVLLCDNFVSYVHAQGPTALCGQVHKKGNNNIPYQISTVQDHTGHRPPGVGRACSCSSAGTPHPTCVSDPWTIPPLRAPASRTGNNNKKSHFSGTAQYLCFRSVTFFCRVSSRTDTQDQASTKTGNNIILYQISTAQDHTDRRSP